MSVTVTLDVSTSPPVLTCDPSTHPKGKGKGTITWQRAKGSTFTFCGLRITGSCFSNLRIEDHSIKLDDDNPKSSPEIDYPYTLIARSADGASFYTTGVTISTEGVWEPAGPGDPIIQNK